MPKMIFRGSTLGNYILDYLASPKREIHAPHGGKAAGSVAVSHGRTLPEPEVSHGRCKVVKYVIPQL